MDLVSLSPEAEDIFQSWLDQLEEAKPAFLACNHPEWRPWMAEQVMAISASRQPVLLDLSETRVNNWSEMLDQKLGEDLINDPDLELHVFHLEHSALEHAALGKSLFETWQEEGLGIASGNLRIYGDEQLLAEAQQHASDWLGAFSPVAMIPSSFAALPYTKLRDLVSQQEAGEFAEFETEVAYQLALAGAIAHAEHWYGLGLEKENSRITAIAKVGLGELELHRGNLSTATELFEEAMELLPEEATNAQGRALIGLGRIYFAAREWKSAIKQLEAARQALSNGEAPEEWGEATRILARAQEELGNPQLAVEAYLEAGRHWAELGSYPLAAAKSFQHAGAINQNQLRWQEALEYFSTAIPFAEKAQDEFLVASLEDSVENMRLQAKKASEKEAKKGFFGKLFS
ncbi:MAG: tetratricopeptide repeat protein [Bacteroidia bacterium]|nr:tetratricopeptide repeat protein [Bacteroidia bacterium]